MSEESMKKLLLAYRASIAGKFDSIADLLEDVILEVMKDESQTSITIGGSRTTTEPPWKVTYGPDIVPLGGPMAVPTGKEVTS